MKSNFIILQAVIEFCWQFVEGAVFPPAHVFSALIRNEISIAVWVYF